jgi:hypothetical protein
LPQFNKALVAREDKFAKENNKLALELIALFRNNYRSPASSTDIKTSSLDNILNELIARRKQYLRSGILMPGRQEDADEGFHLLLNSLDGNLGDLNSNSNANSIEQGFHIRYDTLITCRNCGNERRAGDTDEGPSQHVEPPELAIHVPEYDDVIGYIDCQERMQKYINKRSEFPDGYKCEKCRAENTKDIHVVVKRNVLRRLSSVIVITFKNYPSYATNGRKTLHYFPSTMEFDSRDGKLTYRAIAKIEHMGSERGGHYIAYCKRPVHAGIHDSRIAKYENAIARMEQHRTADNADEIKTLKRRLRSAKRSTTDVFQMNDERIVYYSDGIEPSENTYMVFYHLV